MPAVREWRTAGFFTYRYCFLAIAKDGYQSFGLKETGCRDKLNKIRNRMLIPATVDFFRVLSNKKGSADIAEPFATTEGDMILPPTGMFSAAGQG